MSRRGAGFGKKDISSLNLFEVGPRDGLQNEKKRLSLAGRLKLVQLLSEAGIKDIEVGSFVRADRIPNLRNSDELARKLVAWRSSVRKKLRFWAFVPNLKGLEIALESQIDGVSFFIAASDSFVKKNVNRNQAEQFKALRELVKIAHQEGLKTRTYLSTITYCPYEGKVSPGKVASLVKRLFSIGAHRVVLSDTTGHATPLSLSQLLDRVLKNCRAKDLSLHLHDTRGLALANVVEGIRYGVTEFDSSVAGLGGCPYAPGATGNLSSEDLGNLINSFEKKEKIHIRELVGAARFVEKKLGKKSVSKVLRSFD